MVDLEFLGPREIRALLVSLDQLAEMVFQDYQD